MANAISTVLQRAFTVLPSAARTATPDSQEFEVPALRFQGLQLVIDATAVTSTPSITVTVAAVDRASGKAYTLLASAAIATVSTTVLRVGPTLTAAANLVAADFVPSVFRVTVAHGNANSITYSVGGHLVG